MKTFISAVALAAILSTPAMANVVKADGPNNPKPVDTCGDDRILMEEVVMYHITQIEMLLEEMRQNVLQEYPKDEVDEDKPVDDDK